MMNQDAYIKVRFKTTQEGGRKNPVVGEVYACPLLIDGEAYDCRLLIKGMTLELGVFYEVPIKFLNKDLVLPKLAIGKKVVLWEGKNVGDASIIKIHDYAIKMDIHTDIFLNQLSQNIIQQDEGFKWFNELDDSSQLEVLRRIVFFTLQAGVSGRDVQSAIKESKLKETDTLCQLLLIAYKNEPDGNRLLSDQLSKILKLPASERYKSFSLLIALFRGADGKKRAKGLSPDKYWWHQDLSNNQVITKIAPTHGSNKN